MNYTQEIDVDVSGKTKYKYIDAKQYDNESRYLKITLRQDGQKLKPEAGVTAGFRCLKPDGTICLNAATVNSDGTVTAELTCEMLACKGVAKADICLIKGNSVLSTVTFFIQIEEAPVDTKKALSSDEFLLLVEKIAEATDATEDTKEAAKEARDAAQSVEDAIGKTDKATQEANAAANAAREAASAIGDKIDGIVIVDTDGDVQYLGKFRIVNGYPAIEITKL